ncbi:hypothetical protein [Streptomyces sp. CdTB01]|uniref:hypothetical protein n=1 Tax=Streptomyces sp. CdTB01 TaxID=1725411 RepID=UPI00073A910F|nr:hypothetical protein [Streptomyces sp. CdTB01]ALV39297.1 hypothetical protein AS200_45245 [Streptomyces sp. CdTB01]
MEVLLLAACAWLVHTHGAQSEQAKLGLSPAQRDILRERTRHEKAVQKIADRHGVAAPAERKPGVSPWKEAPASERDPALTLPEAFRSGWRGHTRIERVATPVGRRAGLWAAQGVAWAKDTGKGAVREYRRRRRAEGHPDPAPVLVPLPPAHPPTVPPIPAEPPTAGTDSGKGEGVSLARPDPPSEPEAGEKPPEGPSEPPTADDGAPEATTAPTAPEGAADGPAPVPEPRSAEETDPATGEAPPRTLPGLKPIYLPLEDDAEKAPEAVTAPVTADGTPVTESVTDPATAVTEPDPAVAPAVTDPGAAPTESTNTKEPAAAGGGVGRMAAEVSYESVADESDELSLMCEDDLVVYDRIGKRCQREISRADSLLAAMEAKGFGPRVMAWVTRGKEQYGVIDSELDQLKSNTKAQGEAVVKAKALLVAGQGLYADIAKDMESVADRDVYISDAVDAEDTSAHTEVYETRGA